MKNHAIYFYLMTDDSCILLYRVWYCISYRTENKLFYFIFFILCRQLAQKDRNYLWRHSSLFITLSVWSSLRHLIESYSFNVWFVGCAGGEGEWEDANGPQQGHQGQQQHHRRTQRKDVWWLQPGKDSWVARYNCVLTFILSPLNAAGSLQVKQSRSFYPEIITSVLLHQGKKGHSARPHHSESCTLPDQELATRLGPIDSHTMPKI